MYKFFGCLPKGVALMIFKETSHQDQTRLARVDKKFNELSKDESLELFKFKSEYRRYQLGDYHLIIKKLADDDVYVKLGEGLTHDLFLTHQNKRVAGFILTQDDYTKFTEKADNSNNKNQFIQHFRECFKYKGEAHAAVNTANILENGFHHTIDNDLVEGLYNFPN